MSGAVPIDLVHLGLEGAIAAYLVDGPEPALVDPGPSTTHERLVEALGEHGIGPGGLAHVLLTHIHLDHAGGTGRLLEVFPDAVVHVHEDGAGHMVRPRRLVASTRRTFGEDHDRLWGETLPVPEDRVRAWRPGEALGVPHLRPIPTPGHIAHHVAYLDERDGTLLAGDAMGIVLGDARTHPPTPPPSADPRAWEATLEEVRAIGPERFGATHFGMHDDVPERIRQLEEALTALEDRVRRAMAAGDDEDARRFDAEVRERIGDAVGPERAERYFDTFTAAMDWAGMKHYLERNT